MSQYADWTDVQTYDDPYQELLNRNSEYIEGKRDSSPYHYGPVFDMNIDDLVFLHRMGILTTGGQSGKGVLNKYHPKTNTYREHYGSYKQRPYLSGFIHRTLLKDFLKMVKKLCLLYKVGHYPVYTNITDNDLDKSSSSGSIWLTQSCETRRPNWRPGKNIHWDRCTTFIPNNGFNTIKEEMNLKQPLYNIIPFQVINTGSSDAIETLFRMYLSNYTLIKL